MTSEARIISGITLITVPSIQYGGYFLLKSLMDQKSGYMDNPLRQNFFRAGHAHAGVIVLLSLVCQMLAVRRRYLPHSYGWYVLAFLPPQSLCAGIFPVDDIARRDDTQPGDLASLFGSRAASRISSNVRSSALASRLSPPASGGFSDSALVRVTGMTLPCMPDVRCSLP